MFDAGFWELLFIGLVALIVVGPERLPKLAAEAGRWFAKVRRFVQNARADMESEFNTRDLKDLMTQQEDELRRLRDMVHETRDDLDKEVRSEQDYMLRAMGDEDRKAAEERDARKGEGQEGHSAEEPAEEDDISRLSREYGDEFQRPDFSSEALTGKKPAVKNESDTTNDREK